MDSYSFEREHNATEEQILDEEGIDSSEEGFMRGYSEDDEILECAECGAAVREEKRIVKEIEGEEYTFCSDECAKDFKESIAE